MSSNSNGSSIRSREVAKSMVLLVTATLSGLVRGRLGESRGDHGATAVEYALMASLIAVVIVASVTLFGQNVVTLFAVPTSVFNP
ncbi:Flp/Fap pilin component [Pedococcus cremeus]|uniref:Flp/Fap pilin component n=1 Tax=Pedococcus cremeus TaxID=587636 RepID=A0A1H9XCG8_9MICO|nr:Flp family type IVb pilin [Pedococcus cremeus]SES43749.1 Flp/Fap pilin component [Pedococcus cremeus]